MNVAAPAVRVAAPRAHEAWLLGPALDLALIANLIWPFVFALVWFNSRYLHWGLALFLASAIGTPHRWITLGLVANDRARLRAGGPKLAWTAVWTTALFAGVWAWTGGVTAVVLLAYAWNVWHVAAQHAGLSRVYAVRGRPEVRSSGILEKTLLRLYVIYAFLRLANVSDSLRRWDWLFSLVHRVSLSGGVWDWVILAAPTILLAREALDPDPRLAARYVHLTSVCAIYAAMIVLCHFGRYDDAIALSVAVAVFHAVEYYGFITWATESRPATGEHFFAPLIARRWRAALVLFLGATAVGTLTAARYYPAAWLAANTLVSMLHYAYDGVLWKLPAVFRAAPARHAPPVI
jgi:hypothetical protein